MATILIADDSAEIRTLYGTCLRLRGHQVLEAEDGVEAIDLAHRLGPDLLLLDVWMPRRNGFEVLDDLRFDPMATRLKIVLLSVLGEADARLEAFAGGAVDYLVKGLGIEEFLDRVEAILARPCMPLAEEWADNAVL
jgi:DNA-binding response OmpR family regulator